MVHVSQKGEGQHILILFSFYFIFKEYCIIVPLYKRKLCDGHIILASRCSSYKVSLDCEKHLGTKISMKQPVCETTCFDNKVQ